MGQTNTSPVPFYLKTGFRLKDEAAQQKLLEKLKILTETGVNTFTPGDAGAMYLTQEAIDRILNK